MEQIIKNFNSFIKKRVFKLNSEIKNFFNKKPSVSNFNKFIITTISLLFICIFYLLIPTLYEKTWIQNALENKLLGDFKINFSISSDITYNILPSPHFLIKDSKIFIGNNTKLKTLAEIKKLRIFIDKNNFFDKEKMNINQISIENANFSFYEKDLNFFNEINDKQLSSKKIKIKKSNIFFKDNNKETVAIMKVASASLFYDELKLLNLFNLNGNIFNIPFTLNSEKTISSLVNKKIHLESKNLKLKIFNESFKKSDDFIEGVNVISILNSKLKTQYNIKKKLISFNFDKSKRKNSNISYNGKLSLNPFDLNLNLYLERYEIPKLLSVNSLMGEFIKTKLLFNNNISANISINIGSNKYDEIFKSSIIKFNVVNGKINFNNTKLINKNIGFLKLTNSNLFFKNEKLILNADAEINIEDLDNLFSLFQTPKKTRKSLKTILINFDYDPLANQLNLNNLKVDNTESNNKMMNIITEFNSSDNYNLNKSRRVLNKLISAYEG
tara:strand:- start:954 stop:2450 length:1497 start_codon:yes stop_codon:yes gene_type:complete